MRAILTGCARQSGPKVVLIAGLSDVLVGLGVGAAALLVAHRLFVAYLDEHQAHEATKRAWSATRAGQSLPSYCGDRRD